MHLAITMLIKFVNINIYGSNTEYSFYILYTQNDIKVLQSTEHSNFSLNAACSDFWIHIGGLSLKTIQVYVSEIRHKKYWFDLGERKEWKLVSNDLTVGDLALT